MDVSKSELEIYQNQYQGAVNQLKEAKDNLDKALETRTQRKRLVGFFFNIHLQQITARVNKCTSIYHKVEWICLKPEFLTVQKSSNWTLSSECLIESKVRKFCIVQSLTLGVKEFEGNFIY